MAAFRTGSDTANARTQDGADAPGYDDRQDLKPADRGQRKRVGALAVCLLLLAAACGTAAASARGDAAQKLLQAEQLQAARARDKANADRALQAAQADALKIGEKRVQAAAALNEAAKAVAEAAARLRQAQAKQARAEAALRQHAATFSALVPLMIRMSRYPVETVLAVPAPPDQALEGLLLTGGVAATLNREAAALRIQAGEAAQLKAATAQQAEALAEQQAHQAATAAALEVAMAETREKISAAQAEGEKAAAMVAALGAQADTLRDAIAAMDAARAKAEARAALEAAAAEKRRQPGVAASARARQAALSRPALRGGVGRLVVPVAGPVVRRFGAPAADGPTTGITYGAAPGSYVNSPCTGRVGFAAPFRSYGQLVILECGGGMDMVLAGLGQIDTAPGRPVKAGEPIGRMPDGGHGAGLYVEARAHGQPVDPVPFLNARG
jgi:septal ring factor EnvC (AmiA/AmiB activator)